MLIVKVGTVRHNGKDYVEGEPLPKMSKEEADRLLSLGVCVLLPTPTRSKENDSGKKPENDEQGEAGTKSDEDDGDVSLNINPEDAIKSGTKK